MRTPICCVFVVAACGPMYRQPGQPDPNAPPTQPAPDPNAHDPWTAPGQPQPAQPQPAQPQPAAPARNEPAPPQPPQGTVAQQFVAAHNAVRAKHCAAPLTWSPKLAAVAQKWADTLRDKGCVFGHSGGQYGENLAAGTEGTLDAQAAVAMWYDEIKKYRFPDGGFAMTTGHFTQVVWRGTTQVGCGHSACKGNDIWVCNYDPAGNWEGQYRENVRPLGCK